MRRTRSSSNHPRAPSPVWQVATSTREPVLSRMWQQEQQQQQLPGSARQRSEAAGIQICYLHLPATRPERGCENFWVHIVNTICHTACLDAAFLPGKETCFIIDAEGTLLKCHQEREKKEKPGRVKTPGTCSSDSSWSAGHYHHLPGELGGLILRTPPPPRLLCDLGQRTSSLWASIFLSANAEVGLDG